MTNYPWFTETAHDSHLRVNGVCKAYRGVPVLFPLSFEIGPGEALALLGPNGSGKTTLLRLIAGLERPSDGRVELSEASPGIGFAGHDSYLYEDLSGVENLRFAVQMGGLRRNDVEIGAALDAVGMRATARERVGGYSAGMKRRIGLARMLLFQPSILLLDEPHASLDGDGQALVDSLVRAARETGRQVVIASHDHERVVGLCSHVLCLSSGRVAFAGSSEAWKRTSPLFLIRAEARQ